MTSPDIHVVGMGNILYHDEGIGVYAAHYLRMAYRFTPGIEIADGAALGFGLMDYFAPDGTPPRVLVLDAMLAQAEPGTIYRLPADQLLDLGPAMRPTAHEIDPVALLKLATAFGQAPELVLLGIVPENASDLEVGLTEVLRDALPSFAMAAIAQLGEWGVLAEPARAVSVDNVIEELVTCKR